MTTICAIQHTESEPLGLIADVLAREAISVDCVRPDKGEPIPFSMKGHAGLVVMGGPMGVYEQSRFPFLREEIRLIEQALNEKKPILGICLGSQLLAAALGATVTKGKQKEIGWHPVSLTEAATTDPLWNRIQSSFTAYHWHGDIFALPRQAVSLARSSLTDCQAFRYGQSAYGNLFHMEVTQTIMEGMTQAFGTELEEAGLAARPILDGAKQHLSSLQRIGESVFQRWAQLAKGCKSTAWSSGETT